MKVKFLTPLTITNKVTGILDVRDIKDYPDGSYTIITTDRQVILSSSSSIVQQAMKDGNVTLDIMKKLLDGDVQYTPSRNKIKELNSIKEKYMPGERHSIEDFIKKTNGRFALAMIKCKYYREPTRKRTIMTTKSKKPSRNYRQGSGFHMFTIREAKWIWKCINRVEKFYKAYFHCSRHLIRKAIFSIIPINYWLTLDRLPKDMGVVGGKYLGCIERYIVNKYIKRIETTMCPDHYRSVWRKPCVKANRILLPIMERYKQREVEESWQ